MWSGVVFLGVTNHVHVFFGVDGHAAGVDLLAERFGELTTGGHRNSATTGIRLLFIGADAEHAAVFVNQCLIEFELSCRGEGGKERQSADAKDA